MTQNQKTLSLVEKIEKSSKYVKTKINDTENTYIWHSEHGKNSCENCSSLDNVVFYPGDKMLIPPLHPNCKCELEEIKQNKENLTPRLSSSISKEVVPEYKTPIQDDKTQEELEKIGKELEKIKIIVDKTKEMIEKDIDFDFQLLNEQIEAIAPSFIIDSDILESEKENHEPNCKEFKKRVEQLNKEKEKFNKIRNEFEDNKKKVEEIRERLGEFSSIMNSLRIDFQFFWENKLDIFNTDNNAVLIATNYLIQKLDPIDSELKQYITNLDAIKLSNNHLMKALNALKKNRIQEFEQFSCACKNILHKAGEAIGVNIVDRVGRKVSVFAPIGGSNIQDAMHDFEYAKKNKNAKVIEALDEKNDEKTNKTTKELQIPKGEKTVVYNSTSLQSQKLFHTPAVINYIKANIKELLKANGKPLKDVILQHSPIQTDAFVGIQHFTLHNPRVTPDGYFEAVVYDKYDFTYREIKGGADFVTVPLNNAGYYMQETGLLQNYHLIYYIREKLW